MNTSTIFSSSLWNLLSLNYKLILWALLITIFPVVAGTIDVSSVDITIIFQIWSMLADYEQ